MNEIVLSPVGVVRSPFAEKAEAPRQGVLGTRGTIEIIPAFADALDDIEGFDRLWVIVWFHQAGRTSATKVQPPRSAEKRGAFATRSPHRPNPIGLSAVTLERRDGCTLHVDEMDFVDGTPVLDVKPYLAYADAFPDAKSGWLAADPLPAWEVALDERAVRELSWLAERGVELRGRIMEALSLGPQPHAYRRIKKQPDGTSLLAIKEWRARFDVTERVLLVRKIESGYRAREIPAHPLHAEFVRAWGS